MSADIQRNEKSFWVTQGGGLRCLDKIHKKEIILMATPHISAEKGDFALNCGKTKRPDRGAPLTDPIQYGLPRLRDKALCLY